MALALVGCGGANAAVDAVEELADSAPPQPDAGSVPTTNPDGSPDSPTLTTDAGPTSEAMASSPDAGQGSVDGSPSAGDAAVARDAGTDSREAGTSTDATTDAASSLAVCPDLAAPSCANAQRLDDETRATFTQPCAPELYAQCGAVLDQNVVMTLPMLCRDGRWRLAGTWVSGLWVASYECSQGCRVAGRLCAP